MSDTPISDSTPHNVADLGMQIRRLERELNAAQQRIKRLRKGFLQQNQNIEQTCGKALGYPWFKDDQTNFPGATEEHGVCVGEHVPETIVSELARKYTEAQNRIKRLEEAGDALENDNYTSDNLEAWRKAKEEKL